MYWYTSNTLQLYTREAGSFSYPPSVEEFAQLLRGGAEAFGGGGPVWADGRHGRQVVPQLQQVATFLQTPPTPPTFVLQRWQRHSPPPPHNNTLMPHTDTARQTQCFCTHPHHKNKISAGKQPGTKISLFFEHVYLSCCCCC